MTDLTTVEKLDKLILEHKNTKRKRQGLLSLKACHSMTLEMNEYQYTLDEEECAQFKTLVTAWLKVQQLQYQDQQDTLNNIEKAL